LTKLNWTNGPASRSISQTITGAWTFNNVAGITASSTDDAILRLRSTTSSLPTLNDGLFTIAASGAATVDQLRINNGIGANLVTIASNGYVGIGTTAPEFTLDVNGNINANGDVIIPGGSALNNGGGIKVQLASTFLSLQTVYEDRLVIDDSGLVGIGTTTPTTALELIGSASISKDLLTGGIFQAGGSGIATASYSRFGISSTNHTNYMSSANDLLISGDLLTIGTGSFKTVSASAFWLH